MEPRAKGMSRRDFLLTLGTVGAGVGVGLYALTRGELGSRDPLSEAVARIEMPEHLEGPQVIQAITEQYNRFLEKADARQLSNSGGIDMFVRLYTEARKRSADMARYPELYMADFESLDTSLAKLNAIEDVLRGYGYYTRLRPLGLPNTGEPYIGVISGKIKEQSTLRTTAGQEFEHIVIDKEHAADSMDRYMTAVTAVSALTFQRTDDEKPIVLQARWAYEYTARMRYEWAKGSEDTPKAQASRVVLQEYLNISEERAIAEITARTERNSFDHETQHVEDGYFSDAVAATLTPQEMVGVDTLSEIRGLVRAVASADPKMGMLGVYMWKHSRDSANSSVGSTVEQLFAMASGKSLDDLLRMDTTALARVATGVLRATDPWYAAARSARFNLSDARIGVADDQLMRTLEQLRTQQ